jgi:hypothetical protein
MASMETELLVWDRAAVPESSSTPPGEEPASRESRSAIGGRG